MKMQNVVFQEDALFVIAMMPLNHKLKKYIGGYKSINHLMYMDDNKPLAKSKKKNWKP